MIKYTLLQFKRAVKRLPALVAFALLLAVAAAIVLGAVFNADRQKSTRVKVAVTGDTDSKYLKLGITAAESIDSTRFSIELAEMEKDAAERAISAGEIAAYAVFPENFVKKALSGDITPVQIVTGTGDEGVVTMFKNEITQIITEIYCAAQSGVYGIADAMADDGHSKIADETMNELLFDYVDIITSRDSLYEVEEIGFSDGFLKTEYYIGAVGVMFLALAVMPFCSLYATSDMSLCRLISARGVGCVRQITGELTAFSALPLLLAAAVGIVTDIGAFSLMPAVLLVCTLSLFIWELAGNPVSGMLSHFFIMLAMGYASGCFYPLSSLPAVMQNIGRALPTGVCAQYISGLFAGYASAFPTIGYVVLFFALCVLVRAYKRRWYAV